MSSPVRTSRVRRRSASRGLFVIELDAGGSFRAAVTTAEVDAALRQRELFGTVEYPLQRIGPDDRAGDVDVGLTAPELWWR